MFIHRNQCIKDALKPCLYISYLSPFVPQVVIVGIISYITKWTDVDEQDVLVIVSRRSEQIRLDDVETYVKNKVELHQCVL